nr:ABC transporter family substrate-binding protein [Spelaeicoccus albus]
MLTGCQQSKEGSSVDNKKAEQEASKLPATDWQRAAADEVKQGGSLKLAIGQMPSNFNISQVDGALVDLDTMMDPTLGGPIKIKEDGSWTVDHNYAKSVKLVSKDPQVVEVKLNPKAVWQNGDPITWKDYYWFWKANNGSNKKYQIASNRGFKDIGKIEKGENKFDVKITYKKKNADWANYTAALLPASVSKDPKKFNKGFEKKMVPSNGPFMVTNIDHGAEVITEKPNPKWWGDKPKLDSITWKVIEQQQQPQAYANKELDAVETDTNADAYKTAKSRKDGAMQKSTGLIWTHLTLNAKHGALADKKVRRAIGHAINRNVIAKAAMSPVGAPVMTQNNTIFMPGQNGYQDNTQGTMKYDPKKAKKILDDAGYKKQGNVRAKGNKKLAFSIVVPAGTPTNAQRAKQVQKNLNDIGFKIKLQTVPSAKYFSDYIDRHKFDMATFSWQGTAFPIDSTVNLFYPADAGQNYTGISDPSIGKLATKANSEFDEDKRRDLANEIDKKILDVEGVMPIYPTPQIFGVKKGLVNYGAAQLESIDWTIAGWKK